jgi:hypothetical protein
MFLMYPECVAVARDFNLTAPCHAPFAVDQCDVLGQWLDDPRAGSSPSQVHRMLILLSHLNHGNFYGDLHHIHIYMYTIYTHVYIYIYVCMYVCMHACMHACMYVCVYIYIYVW